MRPETGAFLAKASDQLRQAQVMLASDLHEAAGRAAYLAAFHAAQALIFESEGVIAKTHAGVHARYNDISRRHASVDAELRSFLSRAYRLKSVADYGTGPEATFPHAEAAMAIQTAGRLLHTVTTVLAGQQQGEGAG